MSLYPPEQRIPEGLPRLEILLPIEMVVELDVGIAKSGSWVSRSRVIVQAVRAFIDNGGLQTLESGWARQALPSSRIRRVDFKGRGEVGVNRQRRA